MDVNRGKYGLEIEKQIYKFEIQAKHVEGYEPPLNSKYGKARGRLTKKPTEATFPPSTEGGKCFSQSADPFAQVVYHCN
jgi:hypothetical protein